MPIFRGLARRKLRTALTILGIAVAIRALVVMRAVANKLTTIVDRSSTRFHNKIVVSDSGNVAFDFGLTPMPIEIVEQVGQIPGVAASAPRIQFLLDPDDAGLALTSPDFVAAFRAGSDQGFETFRTDVAQGREITVAD